VRRLISSSGKPVTGPLPSMSTREEEPESEYAENGRADGEREALNTRPIMTPSFNIDLSAMTGQPPAPEQEPAPGIEVTTGQGDEPEGEPFALEFDYGQSGEPLDDSPISFQAAGTGAHESPFVPATGPLPPITGPGESGQTAEATYANDVLELTGDDYGEAAEARDAGRERAGSEVPSLFGGVQDVVLDFEKLDAPDAPSPDNLVSFDPESGEEYGLAPPDSFEVDHDPRKTQLLTSHPGASGWSTHASEPASARDQGQLDARGFGFLDTPAEAAAETATASTLLAMDEPLGDLLQEDRAQASYQQSPAAGEFGIEFDPQEFNAGAQAALGRQEARDEAAGFASQSPLDLGESFNYFAAADEHAIQFTPDEEAPAAAGAALLAGDLAAREQGQAPQDESQGAWPAQGYDLEGAGQEHAPEFVADHSAFPPAEAAEPEFTASEMWSVEETRFAPIDIEAMPVDEHEVSAPEAAEPAGHERGFAFAPVEAEPVETAAVEAAPEAEAPPHAAEEAAMPAAHDAASTAGVGTVELPPEVIDEIVRRVVSQISDAVVREVAWEVVPDCVERVVEKLTRESLSGRA
jgi:hypothetical protein